VRVEKPEELGAHLRQAVDGTTNLALGARCEEVFHSYGAGRLNPRSAGRTPASGPPGCC